MSMQWFRLYNRLVDDEKLRLLAFEDRWHFVALCCLKSSGLLDAPNSDLRDRRIVVKLGVQVRELEEIARRLREVDLIDDNLSPCAWSDLQYQSDISTDRVKKFREKQHRNTVKRFSNVSETVQETDTDTETELSSEDDSPSDDEPSYRPKHVFEFYQTLAKQIGRPVPLDFTPERVQLVKGRMSQRCLADFKTVFGKCRDSPFLRGDREGGRTPLSFDWLMKKNNFQKVLEGNYDG